MLDVHCTNNIGYPNNKVITQDYPTCRIKQSQNELLSKSPSVLSHPTLNDHGVNRLKERGGSEAQMLQTPFPGLITLVLWPR